MRHLLARVQAGQVDLEAERQPPEHRGVDGVGPVGGCDDDDGRGGERGR